MANYICPDCGYPLNGNETNCPECSKPFKSQNQNSSYNNNHVFIDEGDNEAEVILRDTLNWVKKLLMIISVVSGIISVIIGIATGNPALLIFGIIGGILIMFIGFALAKLIWAIGMIFVNISNNVKIIKNRLN